LMSLMSEPEPPWKTNEHGFDPAGMPSCCEMYCCELRRIFGSSLTLPGAYTPCTLPKAAAMVNIAFGNVHGVYAPGNVKLDPKILGNSQIYISEKLDMAEGSKPVSFVFHGGSGSDIKDIKEAITYGVIKMNIDTDTQWSYWSGIREFESKYHDYLQTQIGNPEGETKPNKKYYDPRASLRSAESSTVDRLEQCFADLNCIGVLGLGEAPEPSNVLGPRRGALPV